MVITEKITSVSRFFILILGLIQLFSNNSFAQNPHRGIYTSKVDTIVFNEMGADYLSYFNTHDGRIGTLRKINENLFSLGNINEKPDSTGKHDTATLQFSRDNKTIVIKNIQGKVMTYHKLTYTERYVSIPVGGNIILNAKLVIPNVAHQVPLVIVAHGSELMTNDFYKESYLFASWGIATLVFEKRGVGKSTGEPGPDIFLQAEDIAEAAKFGAALPEVDGNKIGLWAFSQGGWVAPLALIHQPLLHFAMILSGPATTAFEEEIAGIDKSLRFYGYRDADISKATDLLSEIYLTVQHFDNWKNLDTLKNKYKGELWYPVMIKQSLISSYFLGDKAEYVKSHYKELVNANTYTHWCFYDPARYISRIRVPVIWMYGSEDKSIPVESSVKILNVLQLDYHNNSDIYLLKRVNHAAYIDEHTGVEDYAHVKFISPEYLALMKGWLIKNGVL
ncbi:alpha/beta hydrolase [Mucilaginibacter sp.]|uniref:alpha/beta hydrolase family protein n=1 Tax=Mucilaginibacter sp. TaxID=1882438 RepID=UPI002624833E|nr:alpha/beta hydrolase [Mucilaginibacter sp.]MDB5030966.1 alpha/beta hydrolase fold family protein [Mucilaginibacter sp.]